MALTDVFKNIGNGLSEEVREFKSILGRIRLTADSSALGANFRKFGPSFGAYDFDVYVEKAKEFYAEATASDDPLYTKVETGNGRIAIDYNGVIRAIYTRKGKPLAFFRFDYHQAGYASKADELDDFRHGKNLFFS